MFLGSSPASCRSQSAKSWLWYLLLVVVLTILSLFATTNGVFPTQDRRLLRSCWPPYPTPKTKSKFLLCRPKALRQCTQLWRDGRPFTTSKLYQKETRSLPLLSRKSCFKSYAFVVELLIFYLCQIYTKRLQTYQRSHCPHNCNLRNSCSPEREIPNLTGQ